MRASKFADDQIEELLDRTAKGEPLVQICNDTRMPSRRLVYEWIEGDADFAAQFHAARARGVHALAEECLKIADDKSEEPASRRVRIDTRLRLAGKWLPKVYGDKLDVTHSGEVVTRHDLSKLSPDELDALEALVAKGADASGDTGGTSAPEPRSVH